MSFKGKHCTVSEILSLHLTCIPAWFEFPRRSLYSGYSTALSVSKVPSISLLVSINIYVCVLRISLIKGDL